MVTTKKHIQNARDANLRRIRGEETPVIFRRHRRVRVVLEQDDDGTWLIGINGAPARIPATDVEYSLWRDLQEARHGA